VLTSMVMADYDRDGFLDLYLCVYSYFFGAGEDKAGTPAPYYDARNGPSGVLFRNTGHGRFVDATHDAGLDAGNDRYHFAAAWAADALDFDSDGWDDLYIVNGMLTRKDGAAEGGDLEGYFWRQVVARSPLTRVPGTPYDDAWRAINQLLVHGSIASRQRNVFLRNDGHDGFDEISGALGLDLDQDGRSFAVLDLDGDGDPDLVVMADRQAPQLR